MRVSFWGLGLNLFLDFSERHFDKLDIPTELSQFTGQILRFLEGAWTGVRVGSQSEQPRYLLHV